jgi:hypothetical protein
VPANAVISPVPAMERTLLSDAAIMHVSNIALALGLALSALACGPSSDPNDYVEGRVDITSLRLERIEQTDGVYFVTVDVSNHSGTTINNMTTATFRFGDTTVSFEPEGLHSGGICSPEVDPWKAAPGKTSEITMRLDMQDGADATLEVRCLGAAPGWTHHVATSKTGPAVAGASPATLELRATLDSPNVDHVLARASATIEP